MAIVNTTMSGSDYHQEKEHISRSTAHRYAGTYGAVRQYYEFQHGSIFEKSSSLNFGTLVDTACEKLIQEGEWRDWIVSPPRDVLASDGTRKGNAYKQWKSELPMDVLECSEADLLKIERCIQSILSNRAAKELITGAIHTQYSVFWTDTAGHKRKARADGVCKSRWFDLKTTSSEWDKIRYSFREYGYDWQAAWYAEAAREAGWEDFRMPFICVQTFAPYATRVIVPSQAVIDRANEEIRETLGLIEERKSSGQFLPDEYHVEHDLDF